MSNARMKISCGLNKKQKGNYMSSYFKPNYMNITDDRGNYICKVRPINDVDFSLIFSRHEEAMDIILNAISNEHSGIDINVDGIASIAIKSAPKLITDVICLSSDEEDWDKMSESVSLMPIGLRLNIFSAIIRITLEAEGGLGKLLGLLKYLRPAEDPMTKA